MALLTKVDLVNPQDHGVDVNLHSYQALGSYRKFIPKQRYRVLRHRHTRREVQVKFISACRATVQ